MLTIQTSEFLDAVKKGDIARINQLLQRNPALSNAREKNGVSAIFLALYRGSKVVALAIASRKPELDVFEASALGDLKRLKDMVNHDPASLSSYSPDGFTALALAAYLGQRESVEYLVEKGADLNALARNETGYTALTGAVSQNHNEIARILVRKGAQVNHGYEGGFTPLMHAAYAGNIELVSFLLQNGADPTAKNGEGKTPLAFAQEKNNSQIIELLRKHGAS
jgi:ankyrin repeat protein